MNENKKTEAGIDVLKPILLEQRELFAAKERGIPREAISKIKIAMNSPHAVVISGLRRVGKSTLLAQIADLLHDDDYYYVNFEDERLASFSASSANELYKALVHLFGERKIFLLDEIQNIQGWERFVRRFMDMGYKFYITGSNASLLSQELGTKLTGRHIPVELFPFSFAEFIKFRNYAAPDVDTLTTKEEIGFEAMFWEYLEKGGIAEALKYPELPVHTSLYNDVLYRDIASRYNIEETAALKELSFYLMSNISSLFSYNKLKELLKLGSVNTVKNFIRYMEMSWLFFAVNVHSFSVKKQQIAPKKIYSSDTGMSQSVAFEFSKNKGKYLENAAFLALRRLDENIYYYKTKKNNEVDFYIPSKKMLIQTTWDLDSQGVFDRETQSLYDAMEELNISNGLILIASGKKQEITGNRRIEVLPIYNWLLKNK